MLRLTLDKYQPTAIEVTICNCKLVDVEMMGALACGMLPTLSLR